VTAIAGLGRRSGVDLRHASYQTEPQALNGIGVAVATILMQHNHAIVGTEIYSQLRIRTLADSSSGISYSGTVARHTSLRVIPQVDSRES
jgi:hypothetical protein